MKFQYSPGLLGYGAKGTDGSLGLQGMAMYFTDFEPTIDALKIRLAIENNEVLLSKAEPGTKLPGEREYVSGDLFVSLRGFVYSIDASNNNFIGPLSTLSKVQLFESFNTAADEGFVRWINKNNPSDNRYIIDNIQTTKTNYLIPDTMYGVKLKDFTRIEYTDTSAFTLYSSAENVNDEHKALALIKTPEGFRLGNIDGGIRNTNLILDVSLLQHKREDSNKFLSSTPAGTVLTNYEINTNLFFAPNFNYNPASFILQPYGEFGRINWNLEDFTLEPSIKGTLVFSKEPSVGVGGRLGSWTINASLFQPMVFHNIDVSGYIQIIDLSIGTRYQYYMIIEKDGWERYSIVKSTLQSGSPSYMLILKPIPPITTIIADPSGRWTSPTDLSTWLYNVDISTDSITGWNAQRSNPADTWINLNNASGLTPGKYRFDVSLNRNVEATTKIGNIAIMSEAATKYITVNQTAEQRVVEFNSLGKLIFTPPLTDQNVSVTITMGTWAAAHGKAIAERRVIVYAETWRRSGGIWTKQTNTISSDAASHGGGIDYDPTSTTWETASNTFSVTSAVDVSVYIKGEWKESNYWHPIGPGPDCDYEASDKWVESMAYAYISNVTKIIGTGNVTAGTNRYYYWKHTFGSGHICQSIRQVSSTNTSHPTVFP